MNSLFFVKNNVSLSAQHHHSFLGNELFKNRIKRYETQDYRFYQPVQQNQRITIQFEEANLGNPVFKIIHADGVTETAVPAFLSVAVPGNVDESNNQIYTYQWTFKPSAIHLNDGIYSAKITSGYAVSPDTFISEPFELKEDHPGTILFRCYNSFHAFDTVFDLLAPQFYFRVPGEMLRPQPLREDETFDDQEHDIRKVRGTSYRKHTFIIAGDFGVPDWVIEKVNNYLNCDTLEIEGKLFANNDESKWDIQEEGNYPLWGARIDIREEKSDDPYQFKSGQPAELFTVPAYPFYIWYLTIQSTMGPLPLQRAVRITNDADRDAYIASLNANERALYDQSGLYIFDSGKIYYSNTADENYTTGSATILTKYVKLTVNIANIAQPYEFEVHGGAIGLDWGDGTTNAALGGIFGAFNAFSHTYAGLGDKTIWLFHADAWFGFKSVQANSNNLKTVEGVFPASLKELTIDNQALVGVMSETVLNACTGLVMLIITNSGFIGFNGSIFAQNLSGYPLLKTIIMSSNALISAYVDSFISDMANDMNYAGGGYLEVNGQTPNAPANTSTTEYLDLQNAGWTLIHDI